MIQEQTFCVCEPEKCDTFLFMSKKLGMEVLHPGGLQATKLMAEKCKISRDMTILDAGCGSGSSSIFLARRYGCRVVGIDVDPTALIEGTRKSMQQESARQGCLQACGLEFIVTSRQHVRRSDLPGFIDFLRKSPCVA